MEKLWVRSITNTCWEWEREAKSRRYNVIEAFGAMTFCLVVLWCVQYPFGTLLRASIADRIAYYLLFAGAVYLLFVSPQLHRDTLSSWGLGNPVALMRLIREGRAARRILVAAVVAALIAALTTAFYLRWVEAAKFLFSMKSEAAIQFKHAAGGKALILLGGAVPGSFFATCVIRYDNFVPAFLTALKILAVLATLLYLTALAAIGTKAFADFDPSSFGLDVFGYLFWGVLQQLLFSSYFGTRIRKGFGPAKDPARRNRKRLAVAVLNGAFFGLIHINSWSLVLFTWVLGCVLSWVFMEDRNRNLVALGFVHGFLGSSVGWLFDSDKAGDAAVSMGVGPSHMRAFDLPTVLVVAALIAGFAAFIVYAYRQWREE